MPEEWEIATLLQYTRMKMNKYAKTIEESISLIMRKNIVKTYTTKLAKMNLEEESKKYKRK